MQLDKCPGCLNPGHTEFCAACQRKLFGRRKVSPILPFTKPEFTAARLNQVNRISISGVQIKHSLKLEKRTLEFTDVDGQYILKPIPGGDLERMEEMPANEHLTMQLAEQVFGIQTAVNALVFFKDGEPAYLTKRFDRNDDGTRKQQEDFAQLAERSEDSHGPHYKYDASYEEIGDLMKKFIGPYAIEAEKYFKLVLFNYLVHNGDAHLKNFSLLRDPGQGIYLLSPAYDLLNTRLHLPHESDTALDLFKDDFAMESYKANAFYTREDFLELGRRLGIKEQRALGMLTSVVEGADGLEAKVRRSFLKVESQELYLIQVRDRVKRLSWDT